MNRSEAKQRAYELVSKMTLAEKASQLLQQSPAIKRLGINEYNWWNEALHGVARADVATVFPQAIGLAATFDSELIKTVAEAISDEARVKYNESVSQGDRDIYKGLTFWSPNINIFRDPRWGRGQETYGEDPFLSSKIGTAFVKGLQGDGEYIKAAACAKHFAVHSGPEKGRHGFNAECSLKDLNETYLPAFERLVKDAAVEGVMGAYNRYNGEPCCAHSLLMDDYLFNKWEFNGYFVSDCGAICDFHNGHHITANGPESAALAIKHRCNINCGNAYENILKAVELGLITEEDVDYNVIKAYTTRFMLGEFEADRPFADIPFSVLDSNEHKELNYSVAAKSVVLLKNDGILPLNKNELKSIAVIDPNAMSVNALYGNYHGVASRYITVADGIRLAAPDIKINYSLGSKLTSYSVGSAEANANCLSNAVSAAKHSDAAVVVVGLDETVEGEEMGHETDYLYYGDRKSVSLPKVQLELIKRVSEVNSKVIVVIMAGSSVDIGEVRNNISAELYVWYPGAEGGRAVADILFGRVSPSGRLPVTVYNKNEQLPDFSDYSMQNRTYRFYNGKPAYPFGYGLSYTSFEYSNQQVTYNGDDSVTLCVSVTNTGKIDANEVTQVYAKFTDSRTVTPKMQLCGIKNTFIKSGQTANVSINIPLYWVSAVLNSGERVAPNGEISFFAGSVMPE